MLDYKELKWLIIDEVNPIYDKSLLDNFDFDDETEWDMPSIGPKL